MVSASNPFAALSILHAITGLRSALISVSARLNLFPFRSELLASEKVIKDIALLKQVAGEPER